MAASSDAPALADPPAATAGASTHGPPPRNTSQSVSRPVSRLLTHAIDWAWQSLSSVQLAIILILAIAAGGFVGAAIMQAPPPALDSPEQYDVWLDQARIKYGMWAGPFDRLQFFQVFGSAWFRLLVALLAANIFVCTLTRLPRLLSTVRRPPVVRVGGAMFERAPLRATGESEATGSDEAVSSLVSALRRRRFSVRREQHDGVVHLFAEKNKYARLLTLVNHAGLIIVLVAAMLGGRGGWRETQFIIAEGDTRAVGHDTDVSIRLDSFMDEYYTGGGGIPKDYRSEITILKNGEEVASGTVRVNTPVNYGGFRVHQAFFGPAIVMRVSNEAGDILYDAPLPLSWVAQDRPAGSFVVPGAAVEVFVIAPASAFYDEVIRPGEVRIELYPQNGSTPLALENIKQGEARTIAGITYEFVRESRFTGLQLVRDPGVPFVWLGSAMMVLGAMGALMLPHRRLWGRVTPGNGGIQIVELAAPRERGLPFEYEFKRLAGAAGLLAAPDERGTPTQSPKPSTKQAARRAASKGQ